MPGDAQLELPHFGTPGSAADSALPMSGRHSAEAVALTASVRDRFGEEQRVQASPHTHDISHPADGEQGTCDVRVRG